MDNIIIWFREKNMSIPKSALFHSYMDARDNILKMWLDDRLILVAVYELHLGYMKELKMVVEDGLIHLDYMNPKDRIDYEDETEEEPGE